MASYYEINNGEQKVGITVNSIKSPIMQRKQFTDPAYQKVTVSSGNNRFNHFSKNSSDSSDNESVYGVVCEEIITPENEIGLSGERTFEEVYATDSEDDSSESIYVGDTVKITGQFETENEPLNINTQNVTVGDHVHMTIGLQNDSNVSIVQEQNNATQPQYHVGDNINFSVNVNASEVSDTESEINIDDKKLTSQTPMIYVDQCSSRNSMTCSEYSEPAYEEQEFDIVLKKSTRIEPSNKKHLKRLMRNSGDDSQNSQTPDQHSLTPNTNIYVNEQSKSVFVPTYEIEANNDEPVIFEAVAYQSSDEGSIKSYTQFSDDDTDSDTSKSEGPRTSTRNITLTQNHSNSPEIFEMQNRTESPEMFEVQTRMDSPEIFEVQTVETSSSDDVNLLLAPELHNHERRSSLNYIPVDIEIEKDSPGHFNVTVAPNSDDEYETSHHTYHHYEVKDNDAKPQVSHRPPSKTASLSTATSYETVDYNVDLVDIYKKTKNLSFAKSNVLKQVRMKAMVLQKMRKHAKVVGQKSISFRKTSEHEPRRSPEPIYRRKSFDSSRRSPDFNRRPDFQRRQSSDSGYRRRSPDFNHRRQSPDINNRRRSPDIYHRRQSPDSGYRRRSPDFNNRRPSPDRHEYSRHSEHKESYYNDGKTVEHKREYHSEYKNYGDDDYRKDHDYHIDHDRKNSKPNFNGHDRYDHHNDRENSMIPRDSDRDYRSRNDSYDSRHSSRRDHEVYKNENEKKFQSDFKSRQEMEIKRKNEIEKNSYEAYSRSVYDQHHSMTQESNTHAQSSFHSSTHNESSHHRVEDRRISEQSHKRHHSFHDNRQRSKSVVTNPYPHNDMGGTFPRKNRPGFSPSYPNSPNHNQNRGFSPNNSPQRIPFQSSPYNGSPGHKPRKSSSPPNTHHYDSPSQNYRRASSPSNTNRYDSPSDFQRRTSLPSHLQRRGSLPSNSRQMNRKETGRSPPNLNNTFDSPYNARSGMTPQKNLPNRSMSASSTPNVNRRKNSNQIEDVTNKSTPEKPKKKASNPNAIIGRSDEDSGIKKPEKKSDEDGPAGGLPAFLAKGSANHNAWSQVLNMFQGDQKAKSETAVSQSTSKAKNAFLAARQKRAEQMQQQQQYQLQQQQQQIQQRKESSFEQEQRMQISAKQEQEMRSRQEQHQASSSHHSQMQQSAMRSRKFSSFGSVVQKMHRTSSSQKTSRFQSSSSQSRSLHQSSYQHQKSHSVKSRQEYARSLRESSYRGMSERRIRARSNWKWAFDKIVQSIRESKHASSSSEAVRVEAKGKSITLVFDEEDKKDYRHETDKYYFDKNSKLHRSHSFSHYSSRRPSHLERKDRSKSMREKSDRHLRRTPSFEDLKGKSKLQLVREGYKHIPSELVYYTVCTRYFHPENNDWIENIHRKGRVLVPRDVHHAEKCVFWHDLYEPDKEEMRVRKIVQRKKKKQRKSKSAGPSPQTRRKESDVPIMYGSHLESGKKSESHIHKSSSSNKMEQSSFHAESSSFHAESSSFHHADSTSFRSKSGSFHADSNMSHSMQTTMVY